MWIIRKDSVLIYSFLVACLFFASSGAHAQSGNAAQAMAVLNKQLSDIGLRACEARVKKLSEYLMGQDHVNFVLETIGPSNNGSLTLTIAGLNPGSGLRSISTWTLFVSESTCSGTYEQVNNWAQSCLEVRERHFSAYGPPRYLLDGYFQSELNKSTHAYFYTGGLGCTTMKKEILK